ncbi:MAG: hypothetical protein HFI88_05705 [Lachnospiraceae bacterium]|nr:hypothetical protein [Lachnospiraceae bacterium]
MNETRNILLGFEFGRTSSQICYYNRQSDEAVSLPVKVGNPDTSFPNCISTSDGQNWHFGPEAEYFSSQKGESFVGNLYGLCQGREATPVAGKEYEPGELLAVFIRESLRLLGLSNPLGRITSFMLTAPRVSKTLVDNVRAAYRCLGFKPERCSVQAYEESFFYETFSNRVENRGRKVGLFVFENQEVSFARLDVDQKTRPAMVSYVAGQRTVLSEEPAKRDEEFCDLISQSLDNGVYAAVYLVGEGFSRDWAKKSVALLGKSQRKIFSGDDLYARGACQAARERVEDRRLKAYLYMGKDMVRHNVGMDMLINGVKGYYPLVFGGINWYDAVAECELLLDGEDSLKLVVGEMSAKDRRVIGMKLPGLPERPPKATRLAVHLEFTSARQMQIRVTDLGFGDLYPSSGKVWQETMIN